jgi:hypothetical protein
MKNNNTHKKWIVYRVDNGKPLFVISRHTTLKEANNKVEELGPVVFRIPSDEGDMFRGTKAAVYSNENIKLLFPKKN